VNHNNDSTQYKRGSDYSVLTAIEWWFPVIAAG
jgi:hypothetical protein